MGRSMAYADFLDTFETIRTGLYQNNFWQTNSTRKESSESFGPTPLDEQIAWLGAYDNIGEWANDFYSIFYKPLILAYAACYLLLRSVNIVQDLASELINVVSKGFRSLVGLLPAPHPDLLPEENESKSKEKSFEEVSAIALEGLACFACWDLSAL